MAESPAVMSRKAVINTVILIVLLATALVLFFLYGRGVERLL